MENQHRKIKGYRELDQAEIDLMNAIKAKGVELGEMIERVRSLSKPGGLAPLPDEFGVEYERDAWADQAEMTLKTGIMQLVRAVTLPAGF